MMRFRKWLLTESEAQFNEFVKAILEEPRDLGQINIFADWLMDSHSGHVPLGNFAKAVATRALAIRGKLRQANATISALLLEMVRGCGLTWFSWPMFRGSINFRLTGSPLVHREYHLEDGTVRFSKGYSGGGQTPWVDSQTRRHTVVKGRSLPWREDGLPDEAHPDHPANWPAAWAGDVEEPTYPMLSALFKGVLFKHLPSHMKPDFVI